MIYQIIINFFEIAAVISGLVCISRYRKSSSFRYLVYFLLFTLLIEIVFGWLPTLIESFVFLEFLKDSLLSKNQWIYNSYDVISFSFYLSYLAMHIKSLKVKKNSFYLIGIFILLTIVNLISSDVFFNSVSSFNYILGSFLIFIFASYYFYQLLISDNILAFYKQMPFYVATGCLLFYLIVTPVFIYSSYYSKKSPEFVHLYALTLTIANIFMYSCFIFGFTICYRKSKSY